MYSIVKKKKKIKLLLSRVLNINLLINPKRERERERKSKHDGSSGGIIHFRTKSFLKLGEHPSRSPGLPALTRKLINGPGLIHIPFLPSSFFSQRQLKSGRSKKGRDIASGTQSRSNRWMARCFFFPLPPLCIGNCLRRG